MLQSALDLFKIKDLRRRILITLGVISLYRLGVTVPIPGVNADLAAFADARRNVIVADWAGAIAAREDLLAGDRIHPGAAGGRLFADTVAAAVDELARERREYAADRARRLAEVLRADLIP